MADVTANPTPHSGSLYAPSKSLRRRRNAELRLKLYGIAAILAAAFALFSLLNSVVRTAGGALTEAYVTMDIFLDTEALGVTADNTYEEILRADFTALKTDMIRARFPEATGRTERRELNEVISEGAAFELAAMVADQPELLGQTISFAFLGSDTTDLYLKDEFGRLTPQETAGLLSVTENEDGTLSVSSTSNDFAEGLRLVKLQLLDDADSLREKASRQANAVRVYTERAAAAETDEDRADQLARAERAQGNFDELIAEAEALEERARTVGDPEEVDDENRSMLINAGGGWLRLTEVNRSVATAEVLTGVTLPVNNTDDWSFYITALPEDDRKISDRQIAWVEELRDDNALSTVFNWRFFSSADSRAPELAGIRGAVVGSFWTMIVTFCLAFPIGVLGAIYLEEFAPKNRFTHFIEININNLAAVPSIVFGLLGLSVFLGVFGVPRSAPLAGGIVLALMTLPTIIIAARAAIQAVPPSIRDAALAVGASPVQASFHHVLPLAMPGILTGTIIGMAQALGETAPLIMIGMVAFIVDVPTGITDTATALPVQVFRWSDFPERAFEAKTAAAICVLLVFLIIMNLVAIILRRRFERRW